MIEHYKKPSVKFIVNKGNFNKLMALLAFQEENIVTEEWKEKASALTDYDVLMVWDPDEDIKTYLNKHPEIRSIVRDT